MEVIILIAFIKNYELGSIRKKMIILYVLNLTDIVFTLLLLETGFFTEVNILMVNAVKNPVVGILLKTILPAILLFYLYKRICSIDTSLLKAANIGINISLVLYTLVNLSHLVWVSMLPMFYGMT
jgi:hypothetical protein